MESESLFDDNGGERKRDSIVISNFAAKFGKKPFATKVTSNKPVADDDKKELVNGTGILHLSSLKTDTAATSTRQGLSNNNTIINVKPENKKELKNEKGDAQERFRRAGMKARLARRMEKIVEERMTVKQIFNRYVDNSTLHGFRYIFMNTYYVRRFLWFALLVSFATIFCNELKNSILLYFEYPFTTTSTIEYVPQLNFPAISICNLNQFELSKVKNNKLKQLYEAGGLPFEGDSFPTITYDIPGEELSNILKESSQSIEKLFQACEWKSRDTAKHGNPNQCTEKNFTTYSNLYGQKCYTFNSGEVTPILKLNETGLNMALKLEFDLHNNESLHGLEEIGLKIVVHDQNESPLQQAGFVVSPGYQTFVELKVRKTENLQPPYATRCGENPLKYFDAYHQSKCFLEQLSDIVNAKCNCKGEFMPDNSIRYCTLNETLHCLVPTVYQYDRRTNVECPVDCESYQYITSLSYAKFLSDASQKDVALHNKVSSYINKLQATMSPKQVKEYIEDNVISVQIFYQEMKEENVIQEPSYDFYKLVGDVGGQLGLMLGASVLTLVEFVDLFFFTLYHQLLRLSKKKDT